MNVFNFAGGPAALPKDVLNQAKDEMFDWQGSGVSLLEMPFTGDAFKEILFKAERDLRTLLSLPSTHHILFLQGGAYAHYALLAMNLLNEKSTATYIDTGHWSKRAILEAQKFAEITVFDENLNTLDHETAYCHLTSNETSNGKQFHDIPDLGDIPLIADVTSDFLTRPHDFNKFDLIYASAQKNVAPAGLTIVIIHEKLFNKALDITPTVFNYTEQARNHSKTNTPNTFGVYMAGLMFNWVINEGGLPEMARRCAEKSQLLYDLIDESPFYTTRINGAMRSHVNVCFDLPTSDLDNSFICEAEEAGLLNLKGHPVGGNIRASLYNAVPIEAVHALASFMKNFELRHLKAA